MAVEIRAGDIVDCYTEAIVIPATPSLEWDSATASQLARKAGASALAAARRKAPVELGEAVVTAAGGMVSEFIIHAALPPASALSEESVDARRALLETAIKNILARCVELLAPGVGLPNLGSRLGFPPAESAWLMLMSIGRHWPAECPLKEIHFVLQDEAEVAAFIEADRRLHT